MVSDDFKNSESKILSLVEKLFFKGLNCNNADIKRWQRDCFH